jgi:hypothetical protein
MKAIRSMNYPGQTGSPVLDRDEPSPTFLMSNPPGNVVAMDKAPHGQESAANAYLEIGARL